MTLNPWGESPSLNEQDLRVVQSIEQLIDAAIRQNAPGAKLVYVWRDPVDLSAAQLRVLQQRYVDAGWRKLSMAPTAGGAQIVTLVPQSGNARVQGMSRDTLATTGPSADAIAGTGLATVIRLNTRLFLNCLAGVSEEHAQQRPNAHTNSITFIACHITDSRYFIGRYLGLEEKNPLERVLGAINSIEEVRELPTLEDVRQIWHRISLTIEACVNGLTESELRAPSPQRFPVDQLTIYGGIGFLMQHESYHLGQMALLRKFFGYPAMKYN